MRGGWNRGRSTLVQSGMALMIGFDVHTDALREHARRLRGPADQLAKAGSDASSIDETEAFGPIGLIVASGVVALAELAGTGLVTMAEVVRMTASGVELMADAYDTVDAAIRRVFER